jgi:hypothetical protein
MFVSNLHVKSNAMGVEQVSQIETGFLVLQYDNSSSSEQGHQSRGGRQLHTVSFLL